MGDIGSKEAVFLLLEACRDDDPNVPHLAAAALKEIGFEPRGERERGLIALAGSDFGELSICAGHVLPELIKSVDCSLPSPPLVKILGTLEGEEVMRALAKVLRSHGTSERKEAHAALARFGKKAYPVLIEAIQHPATGSRPETSELLGRLKDPDAVEHLIPILKESYSGTIKAAADALGKLKSEKAVQPLLDVLPHENSAVVRAVITALGKIKSMEAIAPLEKQTFADPKLEKLRVDVIARIEKAGKRK